MAAAQCASCHIVGVAETDMVWVQYYPLLRTKLQRIWGMLRAWRLPGRRGLVEKV